MAVPRHQANESPTSDQPACYHPAMVACREVIAEVERHGLLLMQDAHIRSVVGILAGGPVKGSWWSHPSSHEIFRCLEDLGNSPDVLVCRLVARKVTYLHRRLWPAFLCVATSRERWQMQQLSPAARELLSSVGDDRLVAAKGPAARELQERLLIAAEEIHTEAGRHELRLQTWSHWAGSRGMSSTTAPTMPLTAAKELLEQQAMAIGATAKALPWRQAAPTHAARVK